ncbi:MAG: hypothetical protein ABIN25_02255, partial [Ginsengibacter sp.]
NGVPYDYNDYDPAQTTFIKGNHNFPIAANYYDRVTEGPIQISFDFDNCNGKNTTTNAENSLNYKNSGASTSARYRKQLLILGTAKPMKEQIKNLKLKLRE